MKNLRFLLGLLLLSLSHQALAAPPTISKSFDDASILVGGTTTLRFTITLDSSLGNTNVAFTDNLPAGLVVASVPAATSTCFGTFTPVPGSGSVSLSGATPPRNALCFLSVAVTGVTVGTKNNVSDPITSAQGTGNTASASLDVLPAADLAVTKMGPVSVLASDLITYTITVTNTGPEPSTGVSLSDVLPPGTTFTSVTAPAGWSVTTPPVGGTGTVTATIATLANGASGTFTLVVTAPAVPGAVTNTASVTSGTADPDSTDDSAFAVTSVLAQQADLSASKTGPSNVLTSGAIAYTIVVTNAGPQPAASVSMSDVLPPGTTFTSVTAPAGWSVTTPAVGGTGTVTATIPTLASGASGTFTLTLTTPAAAGSITNTATVSSTTSDPFSPNDSGSQTTTVAAPSADLVVAKTAPPTASTLGPIAYTITVTNNGPQPATAVSMSDVLPPGTTFTSVTAPAGWSVTTPAVGGSGTVTATIPTLASGASGTFTLNVTAPAAPGVVSNTATASASTADPSTGNNSAMATTTTAFGTAALSLSKVGLQSGGSNISWSINVLNAGPDAASSVVVTDVLPAGTTFVSATPSQGTCSGTTTVTCAIGTIPSGGSAAISLVTSSTATIGAVTNTATVAAAQADPNPSDNSATTTVSLVSNTFTGPTATGSGTATASFTGGGATCTFTRAAFIPLTGGAGSPPAPPPGEWAFPHGLFDFALGNCTPGLTTTFTIVYPQPVVGAVYWKYGPTGFDPSPHWYQLPATFTGNTVTFTITDGGLGDDDLLINGLIVDQGGPGIPIVPAGSTQTPTLSEWALMLLAAMMLLVGLAGARRRRA